MDWTEGQPSNEGLYWVHDSVNGVLFTMVVNITEGPVKGLYYYVMGCELGFPVEQLTHYSLVHPPKPPIGTYVTSGIEPSGAQY